MRVEEVFKILREGSAVVWGDVLYFAHPDYVPLQIVEDADGWRITAMQFTDGGLERAG